MTTHRSRLHSAFCAVLLALPLCTGCEVVDVVANLGNDYTNEPEPAAPAAAQPSGADRNTAAHAKLEAYYNRRAKKAPPEDPSNPIVPCQLGSGTQFLRLHDCELRGGRS